MARELAEEVDLVVNNSELLLTTKHHYLDQTLLLHVFLVTKFTGNAYGKEGQALRWVSKADLAQLDMPAANREILAKLAALI